MYRTKRTFQIDINKIRPYLPFIVFTTVYLVGILLGTLLVGKFDFFFEQAQKTFDEFYSLRQNSSIYDVIRSSVICTIIPYFILFLFGTSVVGCFFVPLSIFVYGIRFGLLSGYLYISYNLNGIMFSCLVLIPSDLVALFGLLLLSIEAFEFSKLLSTICIRSNSPVNIYSNFKTYCVKSSISLIAALVSVFLDVGMSALFINYFSF